MNDDTKPSPSGLQASPMVSILERKLPYSQPLLREFGSVSKLTMNGTGSGVDGGLAGKSFKGSDRRLKENIVHVGDHPLGIGLYLFSYKAAYQARCGVGRFLGVMADEVEPILPQAVSVHEDGYKMVDYSMLLPGGSTAPH